MAILSILIALLLERITPQMMELRRFQWLDDYARWMEDVLHVSRLGHWAALAMLLLPAIVLAWILESMFDNALFGLFELAFSVAVIFYCLGPRELNRDVDDYIDALDTGEPQHQMQSASRLSQTEPARELSAQAVQVAQSLFVQANGRVFAVLFWFVIFGPVAAIFYRLLEQLLVRRVAGSNSVGFNETLESILGWIEWIPTRITLFTFMLSGSFEEGLQAYRDGHVNAVDVREQNQELLQRVGLRSIASQEVSNPEQAITLIRRARGLILRALVVWLLLMFGLEWMA